MQQLLQDAKRLISSGVLILFSLLWPAAASAQEQILLILSNSNANYSQIADTIERQHQSVEFTRKQIAELKSLPQTRLAGFERIIAIGSGATELAIKAAKPGTQILSTFIPSQNFKRLSKDYKLLIDTNKLTVSATYLDQSLQRQLLLAQLIQPELKTLGFIIGEDSQPYLDQLMELAPRQNLAIKYARLKDDDSPIQRIQPIINSTELFLVLPDRTTFNPITAKWLLYLSYQNQVPLIAFSQNYVKAGAVAACITSPTDAGRQTADQLRNLLNDQPVATGYSSYFSVITNPRTARKLNLSIPTPERLQQQIQEAEK